MHGNCSCELAAATASTGKTVYSRSQLNGVWRITVATTVRRTRSLVDEGRRRLTNDTTFSKAQKCPSEEGQQRKTSMVKGRRERETGSTLKRQMMRWHRRRRWVSEAAVAQQAAVGSVTWSNYLHWQAARPWAHPGSKKSTHRFNKQFCSSKTAECGPDPRCFVIVR